MYYSVIFYINCPGFDRNFGIECYNLLLAYLFSIFLKWIESFGTTEEKYGTSQQTTTQNYVKIDIRRSETDKYKRLW